MTVQYTITVGEILSAVVFLAGIGITLVAMKVDIAVLKRDVAHLREIVAPMRTWWDEKIIGRFKPDDELLHDKRGIEQTLALREELRKRRDA